MNPTEMQMTVALAEQLRTAAHGDRGRLKAETARLMGVSLQTLHARLKAAGYDAGRKPRADKGVTAASGDDLANVSALVISTMRKNGRRGLSFADTVQILRADGKLSCDLSAAHLARVLRERCLHPEQIAEQKAAMQMRSLHPNHLWQIDASVCRMYYLSNGLLGVISEEEFNRNKPKAFERIAKDRLIRYVAEDHFSGAIRFRYYLGSESAANLTDFAIYSVSRIEGDPMHGVPAVFMLDPGAANTAGMTKNLFARLQAELMVNEVKSPRSKGGVESAQNIVERRFEARLAAVGVASLEQLNARAQAFATWLNGTQLHSRHSRTRYAVWLTIKAHELRIAPPVEVLRELVTTHPEPREVSAFMTVSYRGREFDVARAPWVFPGAKVKCCLNPYQLPAIEVESVNPDNPAQTARTIVAPLERDHAGFRLDAPVLGETYRVQADTVADRNRKALDERMFGVEGVEAVEQAKRRRARPMQDVNTFADVDSTALPDWIAKRGEALQIERRGVEVMPLSVVETCRRLKPVLGDAYGPHVYRWLEAKFGDQGVPEEQLDALAAQFRQPLDSVTKSTDRPALRAVGGGS